jgi:hypothetical protein
MERGARHRLRALALTALIVLTAGVDEQQVQIVS